MRQIQCSWVPGTFDRVRLACPRELVGTALFEVPTIEITFERAERVLGPGSLHDLYLTGRVVLAVEEDTYQKLSNKLGA